MCTGGRYKYGKSKLRVSTEQGWKIQVQKIEYGITLQLLEIAYD